MQHTTRTGRARHRGPATRRWTLLSAALALVSASLPAAGLIASVPPAAALNSPQPASLVDYPLPNPDSEAYSIAVGPDGNLWSPYDFAGTVARISPTGAIQEFSVDAFFIFPRIVSGSDGNLWITDLAASSIDRLTPDGASLTKFHFTGAGGVGDIALGPDGNVWFTESNSGQIGRVTPSGVVTEFDVAGGGSAIDITAGADGNLWFTDQANNKIGRITPAGVVTEFDTPRVGGDAPPFQITLGPDGNMWYTKVEAGVIGRVTAAGVITELALPVGTKPFYITTGPDGNLWFTDRDNNALGRLTTSGQVGLFTLTNPLFPENIITGPDGRLWFTMRVPARLVAFSPFAPAPSPPDVRSIAPPDSTTAGGNQVLITGYDVGAATSVLFDTTPASFTVLGPSQVLAVVPPHAPAQVSVTVVTPSGTSSSSPGSQFFYSSPDCGRVITQSTRLTADIGPCYHDGVRIGADNIIFQMNGKRIFGFGPPSDGNAAGLRLTNRRGVKIVNGTVSGFDGGVVIDGGEANSVTNMNVMDNIGPDNVFTSLLGDGIAVFDSPNNRITANRVIHNGVFDGIGIYGPRADNNVIEANRVEDTVGPSDHGPAGEGIIINGTDGSSVGTISNTLVQNNKVRRSGSAGISNVSNTDSSVIGNLVEDNGHRNYYGNGIGVQIGVRNTDRSTRVLVQDNEVHGNGWDGIQILNTWGNRIINNNAANNATDGQYRTFDLNDKTRTPGTRALECYTNTWSGNTWGSGGFKPACTATGGSLAAAPSATSAAATTAAQPAATATPESEAQADQSPHPQRRAPSRARPTT